MNSRKNRSAVNAQNPRRLPYRGRFAPSPTGPLHLGSLLTAVASYLDARANGGRWLLRVEDLDSQRCKEGAAADILRTLAQHALHWDEAVIYQSQRSNYYRSVLADLIALGDVFCCQCTRSSLLGNPVYPGTCRHNRAVQLDAAAARQYHQSLRIRAPDEISGFCDLIQGHYQQRLARDVGDFILRRRDGFFAYQLAVVADDYQQRISRILRGADLLDNTLRQNFLRQRLHWPVPQHAHLPVILDRRGVKLSKQTVAAEVQPSSASRNLLLCLDLLKQETSKDLQQAAPQDILLWAVEHWDLSRIPAQPFLTNVTGL